MTTERRGVSANLARVLLARTFPACVLAVFTACGTRFQETPPPRIAQFPGGAASRSEGAAERLRNAARSTYRVYVANESSDEVSRVGFTPGEGIEVENTIPVGIRPSDIDGAHGITVSPDGSRWYVSIAHGTPNGSVWQFATGADTLIARTDAGRFPATMGITPDGSMLFVANFALHGDREPSDVSVIYTPNMTELSRITTCVTPHGSRVSPDGTRSYTGCTGSDQIVEIDTRTLEVTRRLSVAPGAERALAVTDRGTNTEVDTTIVERIEVMPSLQRRCSPTWPEPATGTRANEVLYVACNANDEILVISADTWEVVDRFDTGNAPYNLEATADGRYLLATLRAEGAVAVYDLDAGGREVARIESSEPFTHGVVASPDSRYAFVTNESVGTDEGTLDVIDLETLERVASVSLGYQTGGIDFWEIDRLAE